MDLMLHLLFQHSNAKQKAKWDFFRLVSWKKFGFSALGNQNKLALPTFELVELLMEVWDAFVLTLNEIMVSTTGFLPLLNAFRFRLSKDLRYLRDQGVS